MLLTRMNTQLYTNHPKKVDATLTSRAEDYLKRSGCVFPTRSRFDSRSHHELSSLPLGWVLFPPQSRGVENEFTFIVVSSLKTLYPQKPDWFFSILFVKSAISLIKVLYKYFFTSWTTGVKSMMIPLWHTWKQTTHAILKANFPSFKWPLDIDNAFIVVTKNIHY